MLTRLLWGLAIAAALIVPCGGPSRAQEKIETTFSEPAPGFDAPRRIMLQLSTDDVGKMNDVLFNAVNLQKFYGFDNVRIAVVVFGRGMRAVYSDSPVRDRVESLLKFEVEFVGCGNTMDSQHKTPADLIAGVAYAQAGIAEIVERKLAGWIYVAP